MFGGRHGRRGLTISQFDMKEQGVARSWNDLTLTEKVDSLRADFLGRDDAASRRFKLVQTPARLIAGEPLRAATG